MLSTLVSENRHMGKGVGRECPVCEEVGGGVQEGVVVMEGRIG